MDRALVVGGLVAVAVEDRVSLKKVPAEVGAAGAVGAEMVDLFELVLADVCDCNRPALGVEGEAIRIAQAQRVDLAGAVGASRERVGVGNGVAPALLRVEAKQLAEQARPVLRVGVGVAGAAAVAGCEIEKAVGPELQLAAVVVAEGGMGDLDQLASRASIGARRA